MLWMSVLTPLGDGKNILNKIRGTPYCHGGIMDPFDSYDNRQYDYYSKQAIDQDTFIVWAAPLAVLIGLLIALFLYR